MPYVKQADRPRLDKVVNMMKEADIKADGDLNYILYAYCKRYVKPSYSNYKNFCGELTECSSEIRRRILARYEDEKILQNGDVE